MVTPKTFLEGDTCPKDRSRGIVTGPGFAWRGVAWRGVVVRLNPYRVICEDVVSQLSMRFGSNIPLDSP